MSKEPGALRAWLGPILIAACAAGLIAVWVGGRGAKEAPALRPSESPEAEEPLAPPEAPPAAVIPALVEPAPLSDAGASASASPEAGVANAALAVDASLMTPEIRQHALAIIPGTILHAVEEGRIEHIRSIRDQLAARPDNVLSASEMEALGMVIDCMEHAPDARDEARDFLQFGGGTMLKEALERACE